MTSSPRDQSTIDGRRRVEMGIDGDRRTGPLRTAFRGVVPSSASRQSVAQLCSRWPKRAFTIGEIRTPHPRRPQLDLARSVNVTNYDDSVWTDEETIATFKALEPKTTAGRIGSMGTTHGIIRELSARAKFLFVSGITDTVPGL